MNEQPNNSQGFDEAVHEQVILPWPVAIRITLRGLKIRFGRSLITMSGVVLGIAFLMSVLTGEGLRSGLANETRTKTEVNRLLKLVEDEIGTFKGRKIGILLSGPLKDEHKVRLLRRMAARADKDGIVIFKTKPDKLAPAGGPSPVPFTAPSITATEDIDQFFRGAHVVLLLQKNLPRLDDRGLAKYLATMRQPVLLDYYHGRYSEASLQAIAPHAYYSSLSYEQTPEERARAEKRRKQQQARQIWITIVSMLVTVIGISNAMLMSVTERIREIGTMKCLGALSGFVVKLFLIESFLIGIFGAIVGTVLGFIVPFIAYMLNSGVKLVMESTPFLHLTGLGAGSVAVGTVLAIVAAIYPAVVAAKMVPADALRTNV